MSRFEIPVVVEPSVLGFKKSVASQTLIVDTDIIELCTSAAATDDDVDVVNVKPNIDIEIENGIASSLSMWEMGEDLNVCRHCGSLQRARYLVKLHP